MNLLHNPTLRFVRPNYDLLVRPPRREFPPVLRIGHTINRVLMPFKRVNQISVARIVDEDTVPHPAHDLRPVGLEAPRKPRLKLRSPVGI